MASFENLVALANYEERLREARRIVWRDRGEKPVELDDLWECAEHAGRGAMSESRSRTLFIMFTTLHYHRRSRGAGFRDSLWCQSYPPHGKGQENP